MRLSFLPSFFLQRDSFSRVPRSYTRPCKFSLFWGRHASLDTHFHFVRRPRQPRQPRRAKKEDQKAEKHTRSQSELVMRARNEPKMEEEDISQFCTWKELSSNLKEKPLPHFTEIKRTRVKKLINFKNHEWCRDIFVAEVVLYLGFSHGDLDYSFHYN